MGFARRRSKLGVSEDAIANRKFFFGLI